VTIDSAQALFAGRGAPDTASDDPVLTVDIQHACRDVSWHRGAPLAWDDSWVLAEPISVAVSGAGGRRCPFEATITSAIGNVEERSPSW
jgi:hypothetical protein